MSVVTQKPASMEAAVLAAIRERAAVIAEEEAERSKKVVAEKLHKELGEILLGVAAYYDMQMMGDRLVITVRGPAK